MKSYVIGTNVLHFNHNDEPANRILALESWRRVSFHLPSHCQTRCRHKAWPSSGALWRTGWWKVLRGSCRRFCCFLKHALPPSGSTPRTQSRKIPGNKNGIYLHHVEAVWVTSTEPNRFVCAVAVNRQNYLCFDSTTGARMNSSAGSYWLKRFKLLICGFWILTRKF